MASEIAKWLIVGLMALGALASVTTVGKPRKPMTGGVAAFTVLFNALIVAAILVFWGHP